MAPIPYNDIFKKQQGKLVKATFKKGIISSVNITAFTADVIFAENPNNTIRSVPLASHIDPSKLINGDRCRIDIFDETNNRDMVVSYTYGRRLS